MDKINKVNRFIKLYPEGGIFQEKSKLSTDSTISNPLIMHYTTVGADDRTVCLIELNGSALYSQSSINSNKLIIWIYHGILLETEYDLENRT